MTVTDHHEKQLPYAHLMKCPPSHIQQLPFLTFSLQCPLIKFEIERRGSVDGTAASHSRCPVFKSRTGHRLEIFVFPLMFIENCSGYTTN
jgi:hypothetical protein